MIKNIIKKIFYPNILSARGKIESLPKIAVDPNEYTILEYPKRFCEQVINHILTAKKRICICVLYLQNDEMGQKILDALYEAKNRNHKLYIRIYVDFHRAQRGLIGKGDQKGNSAWYQEMAKKYTVNPIIYGVPVKKREIFGVLHLKGFVFDDTVIYSGASINNVYMHNLENYRLDRYHEIYSPNLADAICNYCTCVFHQNNAVQDINQKDIPSVKDINQEIKDFRKILTKSCYHFINENIDDKHVGITPLVGLGKNKNLLNATILNLISCASDDIFICTPYFNFPKPLLKRINKSLEDNIKISIIVGDKEANDFFIRPGENFNKIGAVPYIYEQNLKEFVQSHQKYIDNGLLHIHLWKKGENTFHVKGMTVDNKYALITGNNLNPRAWGLDLENGLLVHDLHHHLQEKLMHERNYLLKHTVLIKSSNDIQNIDDYPEEVKKILIRVKKLGAQWLLRKLL
ncbi:MAG: CDP-diacylglycerol--serine O-phosphatidyltransferase [Succinivibrionaceae bacterium]